MANLGLLSGKQSFFVDKMSQMIIREDDSDENLTSEDNELSDWRKDNMNYAEKMAASKDQVDKRFINSYIFRKAAQKNIRYGMQNDILLSHKRVIKERGSRSVELV